MVSDADVVVDGVVKVFEMAVVVIIEDDRLVNTIKRVHMSTWRLLESIGRGGIIETFR